jgi:hypothetical protein
MACEVRKDEEGMHRTPLCEMTTDDFYALASRCGLEIMESKIATSEQIHAAYLQTMRKGGADEFTEESLPTEPLVARKWKGEEE